MKPGLRTTEFWGTVAVNLAAFLTAENGSLPTKWGVVISAASAALYALSRGWAKSGGGDLPPTTPPPGA